jgi:hypothetical protein
MPIAECIFQSIVENVKANIEEVLDRVPVPSVAGMSASCVCPTLKLKNIVVRVTDDHDLAVRVFLAPGVHPRVEYAMQIDVG